MTGKMWSTAITLCVLLLHFAPAQLQRKLSQHFALSETTFRDVHPTYRLAQPAASWVKKWG